MINIFSICFNRPDLLEYQVKTFKKFLNDEINFWCVDNSLNLENEFREESKRLDIKYLLVPGKQHSNAGDSHQATCNYLIKQHISNIKDISLIIDFDIFLIKPLIVTDDFDLMGVAQGQDSIKFLWPGMIAINGNKCTNINEIDLRGAFIKKDGSGFYIVNSHKVFELGAYASLIKDHYPMDSGAMLHFYIKKYNPLIKFLSMEHILHNEDSIKYLPEDLIGKYNNEYVFWVIGGCFLHMARGSNWDKLPVELFNSKIELVKKWLDKIL